MTKRTVIHELKTWPEPFQAIVDGHKNFEIRQDDRGGFGEGDYLKLEEYVPPSKGDRGVGQYTGRWLLRVVTYIAKGWGLPDGMVVMALDAESLASVQHELGTPEDSLTDLAIVVLALDVIGDKVIAEWRLEASFTGPVLYDDRLLIEPTGTAVRLPGVSVAEFRGHRIRAFRHYFDDSELLAGVPGTPTHLRWHHDC